MANLGFQGTWGHGGVKIKVTVDLISFEEAENVIYYCPAFDLSGYGNSEHEAKQSFEVVIGEFFK